MRPSQNIVFPGRYLLPSRGLSYGLRLPALGCWLQRKYNIPLVCKNNLWDLMWEKKKKKIGTEIILSQEEELPLRLKT